MSPNTLQLDIENDFQVFDNLETVTYYRRTSNSGFDGGTLVTGALRHFSQRTERQGKGSNVRNELAWELPVVQVGSLVIGPQAQEGKVNDVIQDAAGRRWSVLRVELATLQTRYHVTTVQERQ